MSSRPLAATTLVLDAPSTNMCLLLGERQRVLSWLLVARCQHVPAPSDAVQWQAYPRNRRGTPCSEPIGWLTRFRREAHLQRGPPCALGC
eukprot:1420780-Pyramimonas_sp.AAC.1